MKLSNAPARKNARRIGALARMMAMGEPTKRGFGSETDYLRAVNRYWRDVKNTNAAIIADADARAIRTKKNRSARGRLTRAA